MATEKYLENRKAFESRYYLSQVHIDDSVRSGTRRYGLWRVPALTARPEIQLTAGDYDRHTVRAIDIARPDLIAYRYYEDVTLWWVIAIYNGIQNPITDMEVGDVLAIPHRNLIKTAFTLKEKF